VLTTFQVILFSRKWYEYETKSILSENSILAIRFVSKKDQGYYICKTRTEDGYIVYAKASLLIIGK